MVTVTVRRMELSPGENTAFKKINKDRSKVLMEAYKKGGSIGEMAHKVIKSLGVHRRKGHYAKGAEALLAEKLGG